VLFYKVTKPYHGLILVCWQNMTTETFTLGYTFYISHVLGKG